MDGGAGGATALEGAGTRQDSHAGEVLTVFLVHRGDMCKGFGFDGGWLGIDWVFRLGGGVNLAWLGNFWWLRGELHGYYNYSGLSVQ